MKATKVITIIIITVFSTFSAQTQGNEIPSPGIIVCVSKTANPETKTISEKLVQDWASIPVLRALSTQREKALTPRPMSSQELLENSDLAAYNHIVIIGEPDNDPLLEKAWDFEVLLSKETHSMYSQGWGSLKGDLGVIASDRNPFLHSQHIKTAPFETEIFKISGTSSDGIAAAAKAFRMGMLNGIVTHGAYQRPNKTILDQNPKMPSITNKMPASELVEANSSAKAVLCGWSEVPENEYRAFLEYGSQPVSIQRFKYLIPGALSKAGIQGWMNGFHTMSFSNSISVADFSTEEQASAVTRTITKNSAWKFCRETNYGKVWVCSMPTDEIMPVSLGKIYLSKIKSLVVFSSLPEIMTNEAFADLGRSQTK